MRNDIAVVGMPSATPVRLLIVEHNTDDVELCVRELQKAGFQPHLDVVQMPNEFVDRLRANSYDLVLSDYRLPGWTGVAALAMLKELKLDIPLVLVTGSLGDETAVECIKLGASDYVLKDHLARLPAAVHRALEEKRLRQERARAGEALREANEKLASWVNELERHTQETALLSEMGGLLQTCSSLQQAYAVIRRSALKLFPSASGALYMLDSSHNLVEAVAVWGDAPPGEDVFGPEECWALRGGKLHWVEDSQSDLVCQHLSQPLPAGYICLPTMAQGESLGILHLRIGARDSRRPETAAKRTESQLQLAATAAEHMALSLANLKLRETLRMQSIRDPLTGLFNRRYMQESLDRELRRADRTQRALGLIMLDLDHFKVFNDTFGHEAGDSLLRALGELLVSRLRREDIACRYGGEEFMVVLPEAPLDVTRRRANELREEFKRFQLPYQGRVPQGVTLSGGVAAFPQHGSTAGDLLRAADRALYEAKAQGRDQVVVSPVQEAAARAHNECEGKNL